MRKENINYLFPFPSKRKPLLPRLIQLILILILQHTTIHSEARIATRIDHGESAAEGARGKCFDFGGAFGSHVFVVQVAHLLFLRGGQRRRVAGQRVVADYHAVRHFCVWWWEGRGARRGRWVE